MKSAAHAEDAKNELRSLSCIPENAGRALELLYELHVSGRFREVVDFSVSWIEQIGAPAALYALRGRAFMALNDYAAAVLCFERAIALKPSSKVVKRALAECLCAAGHYDDAVPHLAELYYEKPTAAGAEELLRTTLRAQAGDRDLIEMLVRGFYPGYFDNYPNHEIVISPYTSLIDWCGSQGVPIDTLVAQREVRLTDIDGNSIPAYRSSPVLSCTIPNGAVVSGIDQVFAPTGVMLDGSGVVTVAQRATAKFGGQAFVPEIPDVEHLRVLHTATRDEIYIDQDVLFLSSPRLHHFGHWVFDFLPRLIGWKTPGKPSPKIFTLEHLPQAQRETLMRFGVVASDLIEGRDGQRYRFRSLTAVHLGDTQLPSEEVVKFVYTSLARNKAQTSAGRRGGRYYLERSQTSRGRDIVNAEEFSAVLDEFQFQTLRRPEITVATQDEFFSTADILVSAFGSDLVTWYQVPPGTDIVVMQFRNLESVYRDIEAAVPRYCAILGMPLHIVDCELLTRPGKIEYHGDLIVDCQGLRQTLRKIIARRGLEA